MKKLAVLISLGMLFVVTTGCVEETTKEPDHQNDVNMDKEKKGDKEIISANNELGIKLVSQIEEEDQHNNVFISPTSLFIVLSMLYNGADGNTQNEIAKALNVEGIHVQELNNANASLLSIINEESDDIQLKISNGLWLHEDFHFKKDFTQLNKEYFQTTTKEIDINDKKSHAKINDWVKKSTNNKIEEIVDPPLNPDLVTLVVNAIYFKGNWTYPFEKEETEDQTFHLAEEKKEDVPFMKLHEDLNYLENEDFQAVSLPYGDEEMSMKIFLPKKKSSLKEFKKTLTSQNWEVWNSEFRSGKGTVLLPKFQMEYEATLNKDLQRLGMKSAFEKDANFSQMIQEDDPVWISEVKQKTFIEVNEKGTEAGAATSAEMETVSAPIDEDEPFQMEINRPFFIAITDEETGAILFMGSMYEP